MSVVVPSTAVRSRQNRLWLLSMAANDVQAPVTNHAVESEDVRMPWVYKKREEEIAAYLGGWPVTLPYSNEVALSASDTDIDHIVPIGEALRSGGAQWDRRKWRSFQSDMANLMLALPHVNRQEKGCRDVAEWIPDHHRVWYVADFVQVKLSHGLFFDSDEIEVIKSVFLNDGEIE